VLERVAGEIRKSRGEMRTLQADESRLARLVEEIGKVVAALPGPGAADGPFSRLRGRLRLPVRGELAGPFGGPRKSGAAAPKGLFIRAQEGEPVRAVAAGRVVYADWMRGFGNLLILDHGEAYLSVYGNNESLLKAPGEPVAAGETIATVGASGGNEQSGLYFELRHLGKAFNPLRWTKAR
jgi:septal ring factor EnvC (AmiA/AmiB activator)